MGTLRKNHEEKEISFSRRKFPSPENPRNGDKQQTSPWRWSPKRRQIQDIWQVSCWNEGDNKRDQGLALLKKTEEILVSKNNRAKIVATRAQSATTHKMHIYRERYNSRIQRKTKTRREHKNAPRKSRTKLRSSKRDKLSKEEGVRAKQRCSVLTTKCTS
jgi:hypothetical protein